MNLSFETNLLTIQRIADLIHYLDYPIDIKDAKTWKYILNNEAASQISGLTPEQRIGLDVHDIGQINKIKDSEIRKLIQADHQVKANNAPISFNHLFLRKNGTIEGAVRLDKVVKKPVLGQHQETIAILTYAYDITPQLNRYYLYSLYKSYYPKKQAIQLFLDYLNLSCFFKELPTDKELQTLLMGYERGTSSSKVLGQAMNLSPRTVEEYKSRLREKLQHTTFEKLLSKSRGHPQHEQYIS